MSSFVQAVSIAERQLELAIRRAEEHLANADEERRRKQEEEATRRALAARVTDLKQRLAGVKRNAASYPLPSRCGQLNTSIKTAEAAELATEVVDVSAAAVQRFESSVITAERLYWFLREVCSRTPPATRCSSGRATRSRSCLTPSRCFAC